MNKFEATVEEGVRLIRGGDTMRAERNYYAVMYLTGHGKKIYAALNPEMGGPSLRAKVTAAVRAGYDP